MVKNSAGTLDDGLDGAPRKAIGLRSMRRARVVPPSQLAASLDKLTGVVRVNMIHVVVGSDELEEGGLRSLGVLVNGRACHDGASKLVEDNESALVAVRRMRRLYQE